MQQAQTTSSKVWSPIGRMNGTLVPSRNPKTSCVALTQNTLNCATLEPRANAPTRMTKLLLSPLVLMSWPSLKPTPNQATRKREGATKRITTTTIFQNGNTIGPCPSQSPCPRTTRLTTGAQDQAMRAKACGPSTVLAIAHQSPPNHQKTTISRQS